MSQQDIRWHQRLSNFMKALEHLTRAVQLANQRSLSELEKQGLIQSFEFTHELAWNVMRDYLVFQGYSNITGSRDATRESFRNGLIENGEIWMGMIKSRNQTSYTYNQALADEIVMHIIDSYSECFEAFSKHMQQLKSDD